MILTRSGIHELEIGSGNFKPMVRGFLNKVGTGIETGGCFLLDTNPRAWDAASANCQELGGQLASINSPARQIQIFEMMGFDPAASAGKI